VLRSSSTRRLLAGVATTVVAFAATAAVADAADSVVVKPSAPAGWAFEGRNTANAGIDAAPAGGQPSAIALSTGSGSAVAGGPGGAFGKGGKAYASLGSLAGTKVSDLTALSYRLYRTSTGNQTYTTSLNIPADLDGNGSFDHMLVYEPNKEHSGATVASGAWQTWDALSARGGWWVTPATAACPLQCNATLPVALGADFATAKISPAGSESSGQPFPAGLSIVSGQRSTPSPLDDLNTFVDNVTVGVGETTTSYTFAQNAPVVVRPNAAEGWLLEARNTATAGVRSAPSGGSALKQTTGAGAPTAGGPGGVYGKGGKSYASLDALAGKKLSDITALRYRVYTQSLVTGDQTVSLNIPTDFDGDGDWDGNLVYEPNHENGGTPVTPGGWQSWDAMSSRGGWWVSPGSAACPLQCRSTIKGALGADYATAKVFGNGVEASGQPFPGGLTLVSGQRAAPSPWDSFVGFADDVTVGVNGLNTTYDFEQDPATVAPATDLETTGATLNAKVPDTVTDTQFMYREADETTWTALAKKPFSDTDVSDEATGLTPGTKYYYKVRVYLPGGAPLFYTAQSPFTTKIAGPVAGDIAVQAVSGITTAGATVNADVDNHGVATTASVQYGLTDSYGSSLALYKGAGAGNVYGFSRALPSLKAGTTYHYRITITNANGTASSTDRTFTTAAPPGPSLTINPLTLLLSSTVTLNTVVDTQGAALTSSSVQWGTTTSYGKSLALLPGAIVSGTSRAYSRPLQSLKPLTTYHYKVTVTTATGTTESTDQTFTTLIGL